LFFWKEQIGQKLLVDHAMMIDQPCSYIQQKTGAGQYNPKYNGCSFLSKSKRNPMNIVNNQTEKNSKKANSFKKSPNMAIRTDYQTQVMPNMVDQVLMIL
jgi:hypothetical protein